jgi:hypothetical protein
MTHHDNRTPKMGAWVVINADCYNGDLCAGGRRRLKRVVFCFAVAMDLHRGRFGKSGDILHAWAARMFILRLRL